MSSVFIALITRNYTTSYQCVKELREALNAQKKSPNKLIILVSLDQTSPYALKEHDIVVALDEGQEDKASKPITIRKDELETLLSKQHLVLDKLIAPNGVLQEENLVSKLDTLSKTNDTFAQIKIAASAK